MSPTPSASQNHFTVGHFGLATECFLKHIFLLNCLILEPPQSVVMLGCSYAMQVLASLPVAVFAHRSPSPTPMSLISSRSAICRMRSLNQKYQRHLRTVSHVSDLIQPSLPGRLKAWIPTVHFVVLGRGKVM